MSPPRVVFDSNVLLSALAFGGETEKLWERVVRGEVVLYVSPFIIQEFTENTLKKARLSRSETDLLVEEIRILSVEVQPTRSVRVVKRKDSDNRILECALEARAQALVSGDHRDLLPLKVFEGIPILSPRDFQERFF